MPRVLPSRRESGMLKTVGQYYGPVTSVTGAIGAVNEMLLQAVRFATSGTLDRITVKSHAVAGDATYTLRIGIFADKNGMPGTLLSETTLACGWATTTLLEITVSLAFSAGPHWLGMVRNGTGTPGTLTGGTVNAGTLDDPWAKDPTNSAPNRVLRADAITGALASNPTINFQDSVAPLIFLRRAA